MPRSRELYRCVAGLSKIVIHMCHTLCMYIYVNIYKYIYISIYIYVYIYIYIFIHVYCKIVDTSNTTPVGG